ncbi:hypothetical protein ACHAWO_006966 [Cyclotella atomus]|uniref:Shugoshin C-terminal domain-containing protein n=1 Tax=Cyclotella atomus TaxID=382360 RepID=A0ABD3R274_9STRA
MENMNLATRCREAIAQVAALKKELAMYQQKQSSLNGEYDGLKREIGVLRRQMVMNGSGNVGGGGNTATAASVASTIAAATSSNNSTEEKIMTQPRENAASPTTDLDRIMSLQKFGGTVRKQSSIEAAEKDKFDNSFSVIVSSNSKIPIAINAPSGSTASNTAAPNNDDEFDADIDMVDFFTKQSTVTNTSSVAASQSNTKSLHHHVRKAKSLTDDVMPDDNINGVGLGFSPERKKGVVGDSLLSSLDAFEASFASAFPEHPFSINDTTPKETKIGMTFDVPDFGDDPFFNNFKTPTPHAMVFDSTPISFDDMSAASSSSNKGKNKVKNRSALAPLSPQSMSAEIEQLDAMANNVIGGDASSRAARKVRNVKQPVSYAEPSTKSKLRRGDVIFPKVDAQTKYQQSNTDKTTAKVLKDLEQTSTSLPNIDLGKDP